VAGVALVARRLLWGNPGRLIVLVAGAVSVALAASALLVAASSSRAVVEQTVSEGWRGTYDLLVRPADTPSVVVDGQQVVPLDYLGLPTSGITREQWERISQLQDVEVAAPVAALGWLKNSSSNIGLELTNPPAGQVYVVTVKAVVAGVDANAINQSALYAAPQAGGQPLMLGLREAIQTDEQVQLTTLAYLPETWGLVVGIDPLAEDGLIGLTSFVGGDYLERGASQMVDPLTGQPALAVPVLTTARSTIPGDVTVSVALASNLTPEAVQQVLSSEQPNSLQQYEQLIQGIVASATLIPVDSGHAELGALLRPLRFVSVGLTPDGRLASGLESGGGGGSGADNNVLLVPSLTAYAQSPTEQADLQLPSRGSWNDVIVPQLNVFLPPDWSRPETTFGGDSAVYRDLHAESPLPFGLVPIGTFDADAISARYAQAANYTPLGLYASVPRVLVEDAAGNAVDEPLPPSLNPAGLNPLPPVGLTNLETVEAIRGDHFIDAIRVRVKGIATYSPETLQKLEAVAQQIIQETGLRVDVVAGSSPVDVRVAVPGVGVMSERWTTLGTAARIVGGAEGLSGLLLGSVLLVVLAYLATFGIFLRTEQAREISVLASVGWCPRTLRSLLLIQAAVIGSIAAALGLGLAAGLASSANLPVSMTSLIALAAAVLGLHLLAAYAAARGRVGRA
jgi:FtsX-like permease family